MGIFTDELNKLKTAIKSTPVPTIASLKSTVPVAPVAIPKAKPVVAPYVPKPVVSTPVPTLQRAITGNTAPIVPQPVLQLPKISIPAGIKERGQAIADSIVTGSLDPIKKSFTQQLNEFNSNMAQANKVFANPSAYTKEEKQQAFNTISSPVLATAGPDLNIKLPVPKGFLTDTLLKKWARETNPVKIANELRGAGVPEDIITNLSPKIAKTKSVSDVKNVLTAYTPEGLVTTGVQKTTPSTKTPGVTSKIPLRGTETPQEIMALAEKDAAAKHLKFDTQGNPIAYTAREKAIVNAGGDPKLKVPFMPTQRPLPPSVPVDTTTGEGRSLEIAASREPGLQIPNKTSKNDDASLVDTITKEPTPVNNKVNIIDYIRTPDRVLKKIGLEQEGAFLRQQHETYFKELPKNIDKITAWSKRASKDGNQNIFRYLDGEAIDLLPQDKMVAEEIKTWLKQWADRLGLPKDERIGHYITHIFDKELIAKEFPEELAKLIRDKIPGEVYDPFLQERLGALGYKQDTWAALDAYVKRATRKVHMDPALEQIKDASGRLEESQYDFVKNYINNINMRPNKIDNLMDNGIKQLIGYRLGQRPTLVITKFLRQMTYRAMLGLNPASALKNLSQGINTYSKLGEKYTTIGYTKLFSKGAKTELEAEGILNGGFIEDRALSSTKKAIEKFDKTLFYFFEKAEHINRGAAYFGAKAQGLKKGMSEAEAIEYAKKIVRDTQFTFGKIDTPLILSSDLGKTIGQFQSFTTKQIEFLTEMIKKAATGDEKAKNFIGLLRYAVAGTVFVYTVGQAFNMKISDLIPGYRIGTPPSLKVPVEIGKAVANTPDKYGNKRDLEQKAKDIGKTLWGVVPAGIQAKKTIEGYQATQEGKSVDAAGRTQFDVGGTPLKDAQALLFGKYSGQGAQDYYDNDMTYAEATFKNLEKMPTEEKKAAIVKIIKENPTLANGLIQVIQKQALGITKEDEKLLNMGVATKQRAKEVAKQINKLDNKEEQKALIAEYIKKKIITDAVASQLIEFLK